MADLIYIALWVDSEADSLVEQFREFFPHKEWRLEKSETIQHALYRLTYDEPGVDVIIIDIDSVAHDNENNQSDKFSVLQVIRQMDPDISIFVVTKSPSPELYYAAGRANAEVADKAELLANPEVCINELLEKIRAQVRAPSSYDLEQRKLANEVAKSYEELEAGRPGTVAYWLFEEALIKQIIAEKEVALVNKSLNVLDVGSGTGRIARAILDHSKTARVTCIDFSGQMLLEASKRLNAHIKDGRCTLARALAERLPDDYKDFDVVILGFGFPCYSPTAPVLREVGRVIKNDGLLFASIYNHRALAYEHWRGAPNEDEPQRPISTWIDREKGEIWIPTKTSFPKKVLARTYTTSQFVRELRQAGFKVGGYLSFPVLYSIFSRSQIEARAEPDYDLKNCYNNPEFSNELWKIDRELIRSLKDKGFFSVLIASKSGGRELDYVAGRLELHPADALSP